MVSGYVVNGENPCSLETPKKDAPGNRLASLVQCLEKSIHRLVSVISDTFPKEPYRERFNSERSLNYLLQKPNFSHPALF